MLKGGDSIRLSQYCAHSTRAKYATEINLSTWTGLSDQWNVFVTGPYGSSSEKDGEYFSDFRQTLNGRSVQPNHWPNGINIRSGGSIDAIQFFYGNYHGRSVFFVFIRIWNLGSQLLQKFCSHFFKNDTQKNSYKKNFNLQILNFLKYETQRVAYTKLKNLIA